MKQKVVEPSEIIIEGPGKRKKETVRLDPWTRFLARAIDYSLFFLLLLTLRIFFHEHLPFGNYEHFIPFEFFLWIPIEALLLSSWGTTPGKFFFRIKLKQGKRPKLDFMTALRRSFSVWFRGLGLGIPVVNIFCLLFAYHRFKLLSTTSWDRDDHIQVTQHPIGKWRLYLAVLFASIAIFYYYYGERYEKYSSVKYSGAHWNPPVVP